ncbi:MAG: GNAT family N-acetyltransferase [Paucibacter sp.]|nr:GNAT family N-acetyltransferase [Roseateles sp.]
MQHNDFVIRAAEARDVDMAVPLIYSSGPAAFDYVFAHPGRTNALEFLRTAFLSGAGEFGFRNHVVLESRAHREVVGIGAGYSGRTTLSFLIAAARQILRCYGPLAAPGVIFRGLRVEGVIPPPSGPHLFYIAHLGVAPAWRGQGLGVQLTEHLLDLGKQQGFRMVGLDVSVENPRAQALYERLGFSCLREHRSTLNNRFATVPSHRRLTRELV